MHSHPRSLAVVKPVVAMVCISLALPARADGLNAGATDKVALDIPLDAVVIALGGIGSLVPEIFKSELTPAQCRWCGANAVDRFFHESLTGAIVKDPLTDRVAWQEYVETVVKHRDGWSELYQAIREID